MSKDSSSPEQLAPNRNNKLFKRRAVSVSNSGFGAPWRVIFNVMAIFIFSQVAAVIFVELLLQVLGKPHNLLDNSPGFQFIYILVAEGLAAGMVLAILKSRNLSLGSIGLGRKPTINDLVRGLIGFGVFYGFLIIASIVLSVVFPDFNKGTQDVGFNNLKGAFAVIVAAIALIILPPLGEEVLVRGYLFSGLRSKMKLLPAMLITSLLFGAAHLLSGTTSSLLWAAGVNTFILSVVLVYLREKTGALYAGMLIHMLNNAIAFGVYFHGTIF